MQFLRVNDTTIHYRLRTGDKGVLPIVFSNSLGTDFRIWDDVVSRMPKEIPVLCMDKRGHGLSDLSDITIDILARDVASVMEVCGLGRSLVCGVSVGGLISQALAAARPDLVAGLVLSNTGSKIGNDEIWNERIEITRSKGIEAMADAVMERWFSPGFRNSREEEVSGYRNMLCRTTAEGYARTSEAIRDADYTGSSANLDVPAICISGSEDKATPTELVEALSKTVPGAQHHSIEGVGHLPSIEDPETVANIIIELHGKLG